MDHLMTSDQAYAAMFYFLEQIYERTKWDDLGSLLGGLAIMSDGMPTDLAVTNDWKEAVEYASKGGRPDFLILR